MNAHNSGFVPATDVLHQPALREPESCRSDLPFFSVLFWFMAYFSLFLTSKLSLNDPEAVKWTCKLPQHLGIASQPLWNLGIPSTEVTSLFSCSEAEPHHKP